MVWSPASSLTSWVTGVRVSLSQTARSLPSYYIVADVRLWMPPMLHYQMSAAQHSPVRDKDRLREGCSQPAGGVTVLTACWPVQYSSHNTQRRYKVWGSFCDMIFTHTYTLSSCVQTFLLNIHDDDTHMMMIMMVSPWG